MSTSAHLIARRPARVPREPAVSTPGRDPVLDVARAGALVVVVAWHWVFTTISFDGDGPHIGNPLDVTPGLWVITWFLQVMPLFFLVGGAVHAAALDARGPVGFRARRLRRLVLPVLPLLVPAVVACVVALVTGHPEIARTIVLIVSPLWFAATYAALVLIAPVAWAWQRRHPRATPAALLVAVIAVDIWRFVLGADSLAFALLAYLVVWAAVHQLGFAWANLRDAAVGTKLAVAAGGYAVLASLSMFVGYPPAMVGTSSAAVSNMGPPDLMVVFLGVGQLGLLALAAPALGRFAARHARAVASAASWSMTIFVWHLLAWAVAYALVRGVGVTVPGTATWAWWSQRPLWVLVPGAIAVPLCWATRRFDRS